MTASFHFRDGPFPFPIIPESQIDLTLINPTYSARTTNSLGALSKLFWLCKTITIKVALTYNYSWSNPDTAPQAYFPEYGQNIPVSNDSGSIVGTLVFTRQSQAAQRVVFNNIGDAGAFSSLQNDPIGVTNDGGIAPYSGSYTDFIGDSPVPYNSTSPDFFSQIQYSGWFQPLFNLAGGRKTPVAKASSGANSFVTYPSWASNSGYPLIQPSESNPSFIGPPVGLSLGNGGGSFDSTGASLVIKSNVDADQSLPIYGINTYQDGFSGSTSGTVTYDYGY